MKKEHVGKTAQAIRRRYGFSRTQFTKLRAAAFKKEFGISMNKFKKEHGNEAFKEWDRNFRKLV